LLATLNNELKRCSDIYCSPAPLECRAFLFFPYPPEGFA
jgi:hypothetical protein